MRRIAGFLALSLVVRGARATTFDRLDFDSLRGRVVLVDFWASRSSR